MTWNHLYKKVTAQEWTLVFSGLVICMALIGCQSYTTPGGPADFRAMGITPAEVEQQTEATIAKRLDRKPLASFPAAIAVARVQQPGYRSRTARSMGDGRYSVVTVRDVESDEDFDMLSDMNMVRRVVPLNRMVIPNRLHSDQELRQAAASVQADMLLIYTFDTVFGSESKIAPLSTFTIGLFPEREARVTSTVSAALIDTRNGYIYGLVEATASTRQLANAWTSRSAIDQSRRRAEREAFETALDRFQNMWTGIVAAHRPTEHVQHDE